MKGYPLSLPFPYFSHISVARKKIYRDKLKMKRRLLVDYLLMKVREGDWHGVADAAMDLRELEVLYAQRKR